MLDYVYWGEKRKPDYEVTINCATLLGCMVGMIVFGILGDKFGRRKIYGIELLILIAGTFGLVLSSPGYVSLEQIRNYQSDFDIDWNHVGSMNIRAWLVFWRFVAGMKHLLRPKQTCKLLIDNQVSESGATIPFQQF